MKNPVVSRPYPPLILKQYYYYPLSSATPIEKLSLGRRQVTTFYLFLEDFGIALMVNILYFPLSFIYAM